MASPQPHTSPFSGSRYIGILPRPTMPVRGVAASPERSRSYPGRRSGNGRYRLPYLPSYAVGIPYGVTGWPSYWDATEYNDSAYTDPSYAAQSPPAGYAPEPYPALPAEQAEAAPSSPFRPAYQRPQPEPEPEIPVTLVFKDGRPTEQIRNYILTRTTLYVQDTRAREIPVADLDLAATQKLNKAVGIDFQLPANR